MNFAAWTAGTGLAHFPEIFLLSEAADAFGGQTADLRPQALGVIVVEVNGRVESVLGQAPFLGQQIPGPLDRFGFIIIAEGPIAEHLEKGVMIGVAADSFKIVVLAANAQALLRACGAHEGQTLLT